MKAITITEIRRQGAQGYYTVTGPVGRGGRLHAQECTDAGNAAALAVQYAMGNIAGPYVILGSEKVVNLIPSELRFRK
jgi:hypothetical protein